MYVPLVKEAYHLWYEIEKNSGKKLLLKTGGIMLRQEDCSIVMGAKLSAATHDMPFEYLDNKSIEKIFPAFCTSRDTVAILEKEAGIVFPEICIESYLEAAQKMALQYI